MNNFPPLLGRGAGVGQPGECRKEISPIPGIRQQPVAGAFMIYRTLKSCLDDLERTGQLIRISRPVDPYLEAGAIQRRVFQAGGPALLFSNVKGSDFPMAANIFGTLARTKFIFRSTLRRLEALFAAADPATILKRPRLWPELVRAGLHALPKTVRNGPVLARRTSISRLPQLVSWPRDGGAYVTLPLVYTESPARTGYMGSNLGMYRVQLSGNDFIPEREVGLHYQIHRGIGHHHAQAIERDENLPVNVLWGPAMTLAPSPSPEGTQDLFADARRSSHTHGAALDNRPSWPRRTSCITGYMDARPKPEGLSRPPGLLQLVHDFPVMHVTHLSPAGRRPAVHHRGRPPQEDNVFGTFIHELTADLVPKVFGGVHEVHAWTRRVHPLLGRRQRTPCALCRRTPASGTHHQRSGLARHDQTSCPNVLLPPGMRRNFRRRPEFFRHVLERLTCLGIYHHPHHHGHRLFGHQSESGLQSAVDRRRKSQANFGHANAEPCAAGRVFWGALLCPRYFAAGRTAARTETRHA